MTAPPRLHATRVRKTFGHVHVLRDVDLTVMPGEIHALVGQNGSGKSTMIKVLTGYHAPDPGARIELDGVPLELPVHWRAAVAAGVAVVHQDLGLIDDLTVSENIGVGRFAAAPPLRRIRWRRQAEIAASVLERLAIPVRPQDLVGRLSASQRAAVGIARALSEQTPGSGLMILDEASRALPKAELDRFHDLVRRVAATGTSILMVSHSLEEVLSLSDRVTVLRDGAVAAAGAPASGLSEFELARLMLGRQVEPLARRTAPARNAEPAARVQRLHVAGHEPLSFEVGRGEIVGITGLPGTGFEQIPYAVAAARPADRGTITTATGSLDVRRASVVEAIRAGVVLVPESRLREGLGAGQSVGENIALPSLRRRGSAWFVGSGWQRRLAAEWIRRLGIRAESGASLVKELSGGNQQKVLLAKWLSVDPDLLVLHEPTQAVDVGARVDLLRAIGDAADRGMGVLLVSSESSDLVEICDRILVARPGRPLRELRGADEDAVLDAVYDAPAPAPMEAIA